jgi:fructan beta-fructosidase
VLYIEIWKIGEIRMFDVIALGEVLIDFTPFNKPEATQVIFERNPGGAPANVLAALAKWGRQTAFIGKVGADQFGYYLHSLLQNNGIETKGMVFSDTVKTTLAFVHLNQDGDRAFSFYRNPGADMMLREDEVDLSLIGEARIFHFGSISMTDEPVASATKTAVSYAKSKGLIISFDPNLRMNLWKDSEHAKEMIEVGLKYSDIVKISEEELAFITGYAELEKGTKWLYEKFGTKLIFVTLGADGCYYRLGNRTGRRDANQVEAVDTTGAGDAFTAGILYQFITKGKSLEDLSVTELDDIVAFGNAAGALTTTQKGAIPAIPTIEEIHAIINQHPERKRNNVANRSFHYQEKYRPQYHFSPETNWLNDPNGLVYYHGEYHLFYQHHPVSNVWGPMHWGHAVSRDLIHWEHLPIALAPDRNGMIFSGSCVVDWQDTTGFFEGKSGLVAIFTQADVYPGSERPRQRQSLAYSTDDGRSWTMYGGNPVLADEKITDFRDPKVFWYEPAKKWVLVLAAGNHIRFYTSPDLMEWDYASEFGASYGSHAGVWECPDLIELSVDGNSDNKKWVLIVSIGDNPDYIEGSRTQYFLGTFDGTTFACDQDEEAILWMDYGRDNYAGVTWSDIPEEDGRRILIGWMSNWKYANLTPTDRWRSSMTIPRVLTLQNLPQGIRLVQTPIREMESLRRDELVWENITISERTTKLPRLVGDCLEILTEFELGTATEFGLKVRKSDQEETIIGYNTISQRLFIDRTRSGAADFNEHFACRHEAALSPRENRITIRIFLDWSSVEVFANNGEVTMTDQIFPDPLSVMTEVYAREGEVKLDSLTTFRLIANPVRNAEVVHS